MKPKTLIGIILFISSFPLFGISIMVYLSSIDIQKRDLRQEISTVQYCFMQLKTLGDVIIVDKDGNKINRKSPEVNDYFKIYGNNVNDPKAEITNGAAALAMCPRHKIINYCIGDTCEKNIDKNTEKKVEEDNKIDNNKSNISFVMMLGRK